MTKIESSDTQFASPYRSSLDQVLSEYNIILNTNHLTMLFNNLPNIGLVLNENRQIVFCNEKLLNSLGFVNINQALGTRPGESFMCIHANNTEAGCGTSEDCRYCGAVNAIIESQTTNKTVIKESRITSKFSDTVASFDLKVTAAPITIENIKFTVVLIEDISNLKRREQLEQIFLHDIANIATNLSLLSGFIEETIPEDELSDDLELLFAQCRIIAEEIQAQKDIKFAEENCLKIKLSRVTMDKIFKDLESCAAINIMGKGINLEYSYCGCEITTDKRLLRRIIFNLIKNAIEASDEGDTIKIGCTPDENSQCIWVWNKAVLSEDVKAQFFQRSFSTKGRGRGLGTYSVQLLTERYLGGHASFISEEGKGTKIMINLPTCSCKS